MKKMDMINSISKKMEEMTSGKNVRFLEDITKLSDVYFETSLAYDSCTLLEDIDLLTTKATTKDKKEVVYQEYTLVSALYDAFNKIVSRFTDLVIKAIRYIKYSKTADSIVYDNIGKFDDGMQIMNIAINNDRIVPFHKAMVKYDIKDFMIQAQTKADKMYQVYNDFTDNTNQAKKLEIITNKIDDLEYRIEQIEISESADYVKHPLKPDYIDYVSTLKFQLTQLQKECTTQTIINNVIYTLLDTITSNNRYTYQLWKDNQLGEEAFSIVTRNRKIIGYTEDDLRTYLLANDLLASNNN